MSTTVEPLAPGWAFNEDQDLVKPMPGATHAAVQSNLTGQFLRHPEFRVYNELDLQLNGRPLRPDICLYPWEALHPNREIFRRKDPPPLVLEILSAEQGYEELIEKKDYYLAAGVQSVWVVSPAILAISIFAPGGEQQTFVRSGVVRDPATGVTVDLEAVFS